MSVARNLLLRMFGRPQGVLGRLGGIIMARTNEDCGAWVIDLLEIQPDDSVLYQPPKFLTRLPKVGSRLIGCALELG